jgi:hypothetical protein
VNIDIDEVAPFALIYRKSILEVSMPSASDMRSNADILSLIEKRYPKGTEKVADVVAREVISLMQRRLDHSGIRGASSMRLLQNLYYAARKGMRAQDFHKEVSILLDRIDSGRMQDGAIIDLERQLNDLRMMMTSSGEIDKKYRDLQAQVESIREDMDTDREPLAEKQEDVLQKFLAADKKAFIIMPFQRDFDNVWLGAIKPSCTESHFSPLRVDEISLSSLITDDIERYSTVADVVVVDLTGNNPNVMFEFGWSLAKNKKPIVICQGEFSGKVAFDVRGIRHISYENSWLGVEALKKKLKEFIVSTDKAKAKTKPAKKKKTATAK